jgi:hypothetical protein
MMGVCSSQLNFPLLTGNPRNKTALKTGFSLMEWIRLTKSGKDLAGTVGRMLQVTSKELAKHNLRNECWMALNGIVYNVTAYMDFHPGNYESFFIQLCPQYSYFSQLSISHEEKYVYLVKLFQIMLYFDF